MDSSDVLSLLDQLDDDIDVLEDSLASILKKSLSDTASTLPILDKAKLYVLTTYAIESILFSYLRLNGIKAREHPVFTELTRVKQYFEKIKTAETPVAKREENTGLDKQAAARFIKAGLSGNDKIDLEKAKRLATEKVLAHIRFEQLERKRKADSTPSEATSDVDSSSDDSESDSEEPAVDPSIELTAQSKRQKIDSSVSMEGSGVERRKSQKKKKKKKKKSKMSKTIDPNSTKVQDV